MHTLDISHHTEKNIVFVAVDSNCDFLKYNTTHIVYWDDK